MIAKPHIDTRLMLYLPHRCSDFFLNGCSSQHSSRNINCICQAYGVHNKNEWHSCCVCVCARSLLYLCVCASIKWNAFSFSDWKSNRQWFLSQSAYIKSHKIECRQSCASFVCMVHIKFRFDGIESWGLEAAAAVAHVSLHIFFFLLSIQQQYSRKFISRLIQSRSRRCFSVFLFVCRGERLFFGSITNTYAFCYDPEWWRILPYHARHTRTRLPNDFRHAVILNVSEYVG